VAPTTGAPVPTAPATTAATAVATEPASVATTIATTEVAVGRAPTQNLPPTGSGLEVGVVVVVGLVAVLIGSATRRLARR
jgi:hypothetical protein